MALLEIRNATIGKKGKIELPEEIRKLEGFEEGEEVTVLAYDDRVELRHKKIPKVTPEWEALAKYWNTPEEDEAWKDL